MQKNVICIIILLVLAANLLVGCTIATVEEKEITVTVAECVEGEFHPEPNYQAMAIAAMKKKSITLYNYYTKLANENGYYDYVISFQIDGTTYSVTRLEQCSAGEEISVTQVITRDGDTILKTEYR